LNDINLQHGNSAPFSFIRAERRGWIDVFCLATLLRSFLLISTCSWLAAGASASTVENAAHRAASPEFKIIPAATPVELTPAAKVDERQFARWPRSHGDNGSRRYSSLTQITRRNVRDLEVAWIYRSRDGAANVQCIPIVVDGVMYTATPGRAMVAVDADTGVERWRVQMESPARVRPEDTPARRGLVYWEGDAESELFYNFYFRENLISPLIVVSSKRFF
jgi:glucose dehydrogenase